MDAGSSDCGFFGKLPNLGDFVDRGLPPVFRRHWDGWITRHIAPRQRAGAEFPPGGLRFRLTSGGHSAAGLILPGHDSAGRLFPLSVLIIAGGGMDRTAADAWCDAALPLAQAALATPTDPDDLWADLDALPVPQPDGPATGAFLLWQGADLPLNADSDPGAALDQLLPTH